MIAFLSHWGFQSAYCNPASGNEKCGVEGEHGWFRRNFLLPVPEAANCRRLNYALYVIVSYSSFRISSKNYNPGDGSSIVLTADCFNSVAQPLPRFMTPDLSGTYRTITS